MGVKKSPIKKAFESIQKHILGPKDEDENSIKTDTLPLQTISTDNKLLEECNRKLIDMDVKLFQTTQKYEYAQKTQDEFLNTNIKAFIQDLVNENVNKETLIQVLMEENEALKKLLQGTSTKLKTTGLDDIDKLIQSIEEKSRD
jgi:hypothetical protein